jgi:hypothetical protein
LVTLLSTFFSFSMQKSLRIRLKGFVEGKAPVICSN